MTDALHDRALVVELLRPLPDPPELRFKRVQCEHRVNGHELYANGEWRKRRYGARDRVVENCGIM